MRHTMLVQYKIYLKINIFCFIASRFLTVDILYKSFKSSMFQEVCKQKIYHNAHLLGYFK